MGLVSGDVQCCSPNGTDDEWESAENGGSAHQYFQLDGTRYRWNNVVCPTRSRMAYIKVQDNNNSNTLGRDDGLRQTCKCAMKLWTLLRTAQTWQICLTIRFDSNGLDGLHSFFDQPCCSSIAFILTWWNVDDNDEQTSLQRMRQQWQRRGSVITIHQQPVLKVTTSTWLHSVKKDF